MISAKNLRVYSESLKILYVEDDDTLRETTLRLLKTFFGAVTAAIHGKDGWNAFQNSHFDLVITDLRMPEMNGIELCRNIKEADYEQPIVVISAHDETTYLLDLINIGVDSFLLKPLDLQRFLNVMFKVCKIIHQKKEVLKAEERQKEYTEQLRVLNANKDKFFSIISHDLRAPFNGLIGISKLLVDKIDYLEKEEVRDFVHDIHTSAKKYYELLENLLDWAKLQIEKFEIRLDRINLKAMVGSTIDLIFDNAIEKGISLNSTIPSDCLVYADKNMITSVIYNLISNAIKFTKRDGEILIESEQLDDRVEIRVIDNGCGISPENQEKLFRLDQHHTTPGTNGEIGTGLGLILCKDLIEKNHGTISLKSELGKGSTFIINLPSR